MRTLLLLLLGLFFSAISYGTDLGEESVHIFQRDNSTVVEYRRNGLIFMVKIKPDVGAPYYLLDTDGDGILEPAQHPFSSGLIVPQWILYSW